VDPTAGLNDMEKRKFLTLPGLELRPLGHSALVNCKCGNSDSVVVTASKWKINLFTYPNPFIHVKISFMLNFTLSQLTSKAADTNEREEGRQKEIFLSLHR
jgi:hypothetical protein